MAQSIDLGGSTYLDASAVMMRASSSIQRKTLADFLDGMVNTITASIAGNGSVTLTLRDNTQAFLFAAGASSGVTGIYGVGCTGSSVSFYTTAVAASDFTVTRTNNTVTIANGNASPSRLLILVCTGTVAVS